MVGTSDNYRSAQAYVHAIWHGGLVPGFAAVNYYYPDQKLTVIVLSNLETFSNKFFLIINTVNSGLLPEPRVKTTDFRRRP